MIKKICDVCNNEFKGSSRTKRCSDKCRELRRINCLVCGKEHNFLKYCSDPCKRKAARDRTKIKYGRTIANKTPTYFETKRIHKRAYKKRVRTNTPDWVNRIEITKIYAGCPIGYHVDHIIPLNGENVSGLHVPWNLQYLPAAENIKKSNKVR